MSIKSYCPECGTLLSGRSDKKYCSSYCRVTFHNKHTTRPETQYQKILVALRLNRIILCRIYEAGTRKIKRTKLKAEGYDFNLCTSVLYRLDKTIGYLCFEYKISIVSESVILIDKVESN